MRPFIVWVYSVMHWSMLFNQEYLVKNLIQKHFTKVLTQNSYTFILDHDNKQLIISKCYYNWLDQWEQSNCKIKFWLINYSDLDFIWSFKLVRNFKSCINALLNGTTGAYFITCLEWLSTILEESSMASMIWYWRLLGLVLRSQILSLRNWLAMYGITLRMLRRLPVL